MNPVRHRAAGAERMEAMAPGAKACAGAPHTGAERMEAMAPGAKACAGAPQGGGGISAASWTIKTLHFAGLIVRAEHDRDCKFLRLSLSTLPSAPMLKALALRPAAARVLGAKAGVVAGPLAALGFSSQQRSFRAPQLEHGQRAMSSVVQKANAGGSLDAGGGLGGTSGVSKRTDRKCTLVLEDGSVFSGQSFGSEASIAGEVVFNTGMASIAGEVVFNTGMVGYVENLTDPSYKGQILVTTYPLLGNYGVQNSPPDELGLPTGMESSRIQDYCHLPSHWNADKTLSQWLKENNVPGIYGVDTRALTKKLRVHGSMKGKIVFDEDVPLRDPNMLNLVASVSTKDVPLRDPNMHNLVASVSTKVPITYGSGDVHILAIDCGIKYNIIRSLVSAGVRLTVVPWDWDIKKELYDGLVVPWDWDIKKERYDGLFISNGQP
ncbi:hypothetical protein T484DRAFT_1825405 [Baffinella frigidus]|nr:hypothetical protein T484DRAFT_1825405 [Cryptophyta sp. CCMP2293]